MKGEKEKNTLYLTGWGKWQTKRSLSHPHPPPLPQYWTEEHSEVCGEEKKAPKNINVLTGWDVDAGAQLLLWSSKNPEWEWIQEAMGANQATVQ